MKSKIITLCLALSTMSASAKSWYVSAEGSDMNSGSIEAPYRTISKAAYHALAGDSVVISSGVYRERVSPANGGMSPSHRITYIAAQGADVAIKGSEQITEWRKVAGDVWVAELDNQFFGEFNPYAINVAGDWLNSGFGCHLGEVYLNDRALREMPSLENPKSLEPNKWHAVVGDDVTEIYANFAGVNPKKELVEINVRPSCFFPHTTGVNYITVEGIKLSQAATQWAPPTGEQVGLIGPNWSKGWIIRNCEISHSKCVGISIGKERSTGQNMWSQYRDELVGYTKHGFTREIESIVAALNNGWSRETVGSHLIENNTIYECGQAGIVGHMGCAFSTIRHNEIYNINYTNEFGGFETGGIKLHAAIDAVIENNIIVNTRRAIWLDWQVQGTHIRGNIFDKSIEQDLFIEVSHGPTMVYNNIMLSPTALLVDAQGIAYANNLIAGRVHSYASSDRYTPYHHAHSTKLRGLFNNNGGDLRFYNNIFLATEQKVGDNLGFTGLSKFNKYPAGSEAPTATGKQNIPQTLSAIFPIYTACNLYFEGGVPYAKEQGQTLLEKKAEKIVLSKGADGYYLSSYPALDDIQDAESVAVNSSMLGRTIISEQEFENRDASPFSLDVDMLGVERNSKNPVVGPLESYNGSAPIWKK